MSLHRAPRVLAISPSRPGPWLERLDDAVALGADGLLLRLLEEPEATERVVVDLAAAGWTRRLRILLRVFPGQEATGLALAEAHSLGLHLPSRLDPHPWRAGFQGPLSASCHSADELHRAGAAGVDFALLSPVHRPSSKPEDARAPLTWRGFAGLARASRVPVLALGGVGPEQLELALAHGAAGVAGISAFWADGS